MLFLFLRLNFYLQYAGGEKEEGEYDIRQRSKCKWYCLNYSNSI